MQGKYGESDKIGNEMAPWARFGNVQTVKPLSVDPEDTTWSGNPFMDAYHEIVSACEKYSGPDDNKTTAEVSSILENMAKSISDYNPNKLKGQYDAFLDYLSGNSVSAAIAGIKYSVPTQYGQMLESKEREEKMKLIAPVMQELILNNPDYVAKLNSIIPEPQKLEWKKLGYDVLDTIKSHPGDAAKATVITLAVPLIITIGACYAAIAFSCCVGDSSGFSDDFSDFSDKAMGQAFIVYGGGITDSDTNPQDDLNEGLNELDKMAIQGYFVLNTAKGDVNLERVVAVDAKYTDLGKVESVFYDGEWTNCSDLPEWMRLYTEDDLKGLNLCDVPFFMRTLDDDDIVQGNLPMTHIDGYGRLWEIIYPEANPLIKGIDTGDTKTETFGIFLERTYKNTSYHYLGVVTDNPDGIYIRKTHEPGSDGSSGTSGEINLADLSCVYEISELANSRIVKLDEDLYLHGFRIDTNDRIAKFQVTDSDGNEFFRFERILTT